MLRKLKGVSICCLLMAVACQKELSFSGDEGVITAQAGEDQTITLPLDSVLLQGNGITSAGTTITAFQWKVLSGPGNLFIQNSTAASTWVTGLLEGNYNFELSVRNSKRQSARDTVLVTVFDKGDKEYIFYDFDIHNSLNCIINIPNIIRDTAGINLKVFMRRKYPDGNMSYWFEITKTSTNDLYYQITGNSLVVKIDENCWDVFLDIPVYDVKIINP